MKETAEFSENLKCIRKAKETEENINESTGEIEINACNFIQRLSPMGPCCFLLGVT